MYRNPNPIKVFIPNDTYVVEMNSKGKEVKRPLVPSSRFLKVVDQTANRDFFRNPFGWPRSSIAQIAAAQTIEQYRLVADNLTKNPGTYNMPAAKDGKVTNYRPADLERAVSLVKPRSCQLAFEVEEFANIVAQYDNKKIDEAYEKAVEEMDQKRVQHVSEPAPVPAPAAES